jgi:hypothetical protein
VFSRDRMGDSWVNTHYWQDVLRTDTAMIKGWPRGPGWGSRRS